MNKFKIILLLLSVFVAIALPIYAITYNEDINLGTNYKIFTQSDKVSLNESGVLELKALTNTAKPAIVWRLQDDQRIGAWVCHDYSENDDRPHKHCSLETWFPGDATRPPGLYTRFAVGWGEEKAHIKFSLADVEFAEGVPTTFNASMTQNSSNGFTTQSDTNAVINLNRGETSTSSASIKFKSEGNSKWAIGLLDTNNDLVIKRTAGGGEKFRVTSQGLEADNIVLKSPNGTRFSITVNDSGQLVSTPL